jgi:hypothetical protein
MRAAKQKKSDDITVRAQRMATNRFNQAANNYNDITGNSTLESIEANRRQLKNAAVANSVLGRQGKSILNAPEPEVRAPVRKTQVFVPRDADSSKQIVSKRRVQKHIEAADSIPPAQRRAMQEQVQTRRDSAPRFLPQNSSAPQQKYVSNQQQQQFTVQRQVDNRPSFNRTEVQAAQQQPQQRYISAHGITHNPVEENRRRKKLEAKIRDLARNSNPN